MQLAVPEEKRHHLRRSALFTLLLALPVLAAAALSIFEIRNDDLGFHVATGRYIRATGSVPDYNPFSYAEDGAVWVQHQWLPAVLASLVDDLGGPKALIVTKAILVALVFLVLARHAWVAGGALCALPVLLALAVSASANRFYARPYLMSALALAIVTTSLLRWQARGFRFGSPVLLAGAATVVGLHLHAGGLDSVLVWATVSFGALALIRSQGRHALGRVLLAAALVLAVAAGSLALLAPAGVAGVLLPLQFSFDPYWNKHLIEFRPLPLMLQFWPQWLFVVIAGAGALLAGWRRRPVELLLLAGFGLLAVRHARMVWPMVIVATACLSTLLGSARATRRPAEPDRLHWAAAVVATLAILAAAGAQQARLFRMGLGDDGFDRRNLPIELMERAADLPAEVFVSDGFAGTWLWRHFRLSAPDDHQRHLPPEERRRVLIHNCLECYARETYVDLYQHIRYGLPGWDERALGLGIRTFLVRHTSPGERRLQEGAPNLRQQLFGDDRFLLVDFDDVATLWVLKDSAPAGLTGLNGFPVDPDSGAVRSGATYSELRDALSAHAAASPNTTRSLLMLARGARAVGDLATMAQAVREALERAPRDPQARQLYREVMELARARP